MLPDRMWFSMAPKLRHCTAVRAFFLLWCFYGRLHVHRKCLCGPDGYDACNLNWFTVAAKRLPHTLVSSAVEREWATDQFWKFHHLMCCLVCVIGLAELRHKTIRWSVLQTFHLDFHYDYFHWANTGSCQFVCLFFPLDLIARTHPPRIVKLWLVSYQADYSGVSCFDSIVTLVCKIMHKILLCDPWIYTSRITFVFRLKVLMLGFYFQTGYLVWYCNLCI